MPPNSTPSNCVPVGIENSPTKERPMAALQSPNGQGVATVTPGSAACAGGASEMTRATVENSALSMIDVR